MEYGVYMGSEHNFLESGLSFHLGFWEWNASCQAYAASTFTRWSISWDHCWHFLNVLTEVRSILLFVEGERFYKALKDAKESPHNRRIWSKLPLPKLRKYVVSSGYGSSVDQKKFSLIKQKIYRQYGKSYHCLGYGRQSQYTQVSVGRNFRMTLKENMLCWVLE